MPFGLKRTVGILGHYSEAWAIALQLGVEAGGSMWKMWKTVEANRELVEASGSHGRCREAVEDMWETGKGCRGSGRGLEGHGKVRKRREGTGNNGTLHSCRSSISLIGSLRSYIQNKSKCCQSREEGKI